MSTKSFDYTIIDGLPDSPARPFMMSITARALIEGATDIHLHRNGPCFFRSCDSLKRAANWNQTFKPQSGEVVAITNESGILTKERYDLIKNALSEAASRNAAEGSPAFEIKPGKTLVVRLKNYQLRIQALQSSRDEVMLLRLQPRQPQPLHDETNKSGVLDKLPGVLEFVRKASGLIVVCGPQGSGKTTLASSIVKDWAELGRHIVTLEDPVEYFLEPANGMVTNIPTRLQPSGDGLDLDEAIAQVLRADLDGLFFGEIRNPKALAESLRFAAAREPVLTTLHSGSPLDAIIRINSMLSHELGESTARVTLANNLAGIIYVSLAFTKENQPVPVILSFPVSNDLMRKALEEGKPLELGNRLSDVLSQARSIDGAVTIEVAKMAARCRGATEDSINRALPADLVQTLSTRRVA